MYVKRLIWAVLCRESCEKNILFTLLLLLHLSVLVSCLQASSEQKKSPEVIEIVVVTAPVAIITPVVATAPVNSTHQPPKTPVQTTISSQITTPTSNNNTEFHSFYLLNGEHATMECVLCHSDGIPNSRTASCVRCHQQNKQETVTESECGFCHGTDTWPEALRKHVGYETTECLACHDPHFMPVHLPGHCSDCHTTSGWEVINKLPTEFMECKLCHSDLKPRRHYNEQCGLCHIAQSWAEVTFEHTGFTNCEACHQKPKNHTDSRCNFCHHTLDWASGSWYHLLFMEFPNPSIIILSRFNKSSCQSRHTASVMPSHPQLNLSPQDSVLDGTE